MGATFSWSLLAHISSQLNNMNILSLVVHGTKEVPNLGKVEREVKAPEGHFERATFGMGWFWGSESTFGSQPGVVLTTVGYAGGQSARPTYYKMGDHTECVDVYFDPCIITFEHLLKIFWTNHDPTTHKSRQYRSIILCHDPIQTELALQSLQLQQKQRQKKINTAVENFSTFHQAEEKHQKNQLRRHPALLACLDWEGSLASSYVATRINGYLGGHTNMASFNKEWESLGLSKDIASYVRKVIIKRS